MEVIPFNLNEDASEIKLKRADRRRAKRQQVKETKREAKEKNRKESINRKQIREIKKETNLVRDLLGIINSYYPNLINQLKEVKDNRHQSYVKYDISVILLERILSGIFSFESLSAMTKGLNNDNAINNIAAYLGIEKLDELPHGDTMNDCFKKIDPNDLQSLIHKMISRLLRRNTFIDSRINGSDWQILVDATECFRSSKRHCEHCLFSRHKNRDGDVTRISYHHNVLEAKLVLNNSLVFSIQSEFIENEQPIPSEEELYSREYSEPSKDKIKQDCETKAFYRLTSKLKAAFPKLPICIVTDSLYPSKGVFETCKKLGWHYIMRFKDGSIPSLAKQFYEEAEKHAQGMYEHREEAQLTYRFVNGLIYEGFTINSVELKDNSVKYPFLFITDYPITLDNFKRVMEHGRRRWSIENQGFNRQKNHGYHLNHIFCRDYNAMKIHYLLIQVAHAISQLWEHSSNMKTLNYSIKELHEDLKITFLTIVLTDADIEYASMRKRIVLDNGRVA